MADTKINGALFQSMVTEGALAITEQKEQINELNVFPVPDGDTGTNMSMTMTAAMNELAKLSEPTLAKAADTTASALLRGARGNSGVILSLLFRGMAKKLRETEAANGRDLALALREGVDTAYKAVMKPAEGTILTVSRVAAQKTVEQCQADDSLSAEQVLAAIVEHGKAALAETVHQNPVLEKAGVVDAGGFGFITILEGMLDAMRGIHKERTFWIAIGLFFTSAPQQLLMTEAGQGGGELRGDPRRGHHVHILHRIYRGTQGQGAQCRPPACDLERHRRLARCGRG